MNPPETASSRPPPSDPVVRDALMELVGLGVRIARVATELAEVERRVVAVVEAGLPASLGGAGLDEARMAGLAVDSVDAALAAAAPRIAAAAPRIAAASQAFERVSRAVRRTAALVRRLDCGWPRRGGSDDRQAMARRQVARSVGERIAAHAEGERAERLFDDLAERLDALQLEGALEQPVEAVIAEICRDLGLAAQPAPVGRMPDSAALSFELGAATVPVELNPATVPVELNAATVPVDEPDG